MSEARSLVERAASDTMRPSRVRARASEALSPEPAPTMRACLKPALGMGTGPSPLTVEIAAAGAVRGRTKDAPTRELWDMAELLGTEIFTLAIALVLAGR